MKKNLFLFSIVIFSFTANAQGTWTQKANFPGIARSGATGFSIGAKGYIGTGMDQSGFVYQDFWEWDQATNAWTQKANFGGVARAYAFGFSIGTKGYIGTGSDATLPYKQDFWEWDQATNIWTQKANFNTTRRMAVAFSISTKGYVGTGNNGPSLQQDFWEWNQSTNIWTQMANFGGTTRERAVGFSIGTKGYIGTGADGSWKQDFWEWDQATNSWTQKANFGGTGRYRAVGFSIGAKGYIGTGTEATWKQDFWEWDQATNTWAQKTNFGGTARGGAVGFSIGTKGYIGTGTDGSPRKDFWEFDPNCNITVNLTLVPDTANPLIWYGYDTITGGTTPYSYLWDFGDGNTSTQPYPTHTYSVVGNYVICLTVTDAGNCSSSTCDTTYKVFSPNSIQTLNIVNPTTGIEPINNINSINIFPNPSNGKFILSIEETKGQISIYNLHGEKIYSSQINSTKSEIDLSKQPKGVYFIKINTEQGAITKKLLIQ